MLHFCVACSAYIARVSAGYNNKEAQLSLPKTCYSLYSSCCSTNLQDRPSSMIFISSERSRYCHFSNPFNPKFENVPVALHPQNFVHREPQHKANYSCKKFPFMTKRLSRIHLLWMDRQAN